MIGSVAIFTATVIAFFLAGFSVTETVLIMSALAIMGVLVGSAATLFNVPDLMLAGSSRIFGLMYFWFILRVLRAMRFLSRSIRRRFDIDRCVLYDRYRGDNPKYKDPERRSFSDRRNAARSGTG